MTKDQKVEEGKVFSLFAARMFERRVLHAHREQVAQERQPELLQEFDDENKATKGNEDDDGSEEEEDDEEDDNDGDGEEDDNDGDGEENGNDSDGEQGERKKRRVGAPSSYLTKLRISAHPVRDSQGGQEGLDLCHPDLRPTGYSSVPRTNGTRSTTSVITRTRR